MATAAHELTNPATFTPREGRFAMPASPLMHRLPDILRAAGCVVVEFPGWRDRDRGWSWSPKGVMLHHDGSPIGEAQDAYAYAEWLFTVGRPAEGIPAPLSQIWIDFHGRWWIGAAGAANHAGEPTGDGWGVVDGREDSIGIEMDNTTSEPTTADQWEALHRGLPAIFTAFGWNPANALTAHKEYARGRKSDPDDIDMPQLRDDVAELMASPLDPPDAPPPPKKDDDMSLQRETQVLPAPRDETGEVITDTDDRPKNPTPVSIAGPDGSGGIKFGRTYFSILFPADRDNPGPFNVWVERIDADAQPEQLWADTWARPTRARTRVDLSTRVPAGTHGLIVAHDAPFPASVLIEVEPFTG